MIDEIYQKIYVPYGINYFCRNRLNFENRCSIRAILKSKVIGLNLEVKLAWIGIKKSTSGRSAPSLN